MKRAWNKREISPISRSKPRIGQRRKWLLKGQVRKSGWQGKYLMNYLRKKGGVTMSKFWKIVEIINEVFKVLYRILRNKKNDGN